MSSVSAAGSPLSSALFSAQYAAKTASLQKDATKMQGDMAIKLIEAASISPSHGLDIRV
jgi:hypothetical protein